MKIHLLISFRFSFISNWNQNSNHLGVKCGKYGNSWSCNGCLKKFGIDSCYGKHCGLVINNDSKLACEEKGNSNFCNNK